jgi:hypothetical protein
MLGARGDTIAEMGIEAVESAPGEMARRERDMAESGRVEVTERGRVESKDLGREVVECIDAAPLGLGVRDGVGASAERAG